MLYAIVDIETTGSYALGAAITEIAIVTHDGVNVLHTYETLINPRLPIPWFIQNLTGISNEMVANAPDFAEVAGQIFELLQDKVFVAHNVNFDYSFVKHQLGLAGYDYEARKLCTVRLARKLIPGMRSYSLGKLSHQLGIGHSDHHRAGGDARATAVLFSMIVSRDETGVIEGMLKGRSKDSYLPPHLPVAQVEALPAQPGVYYFYNAAGKVVYIGKAINLLKRVKSHFSNNKTNRQKQDFLREIHQISYKVCATELMAHILESSEIRRLWPIYNRSQRGYLPQFGLIAYTDQRGFSRLVVEKILPHFNTVYSFNSLAEGHNRLRELIAEFGLCPRLCSLAHTTNCDAAIDRGDCAGSCTSPALLYNSKVDEAILWLQRHLPTFAYMDVGLTADQFSCILIRQGNFAGMGYIDATEIPDTADALLERLDPIQDNDFIRNLIYKHAAAYPERCKALS